MSSRRAGGLRFRYVQFGRAGEIGGCVGAGVGIVPLTGACPPITSGGESSRIGVTERDAGFSAGAAAVRPAATASEHGGTDLMSPFVAIAATTPAHEKPEGTAPCAREVCPTTRFLA